VIFTLRLVLLLALHILGAQAWSHVPETSLIYGYDTVEYIVIDRDIEFQAQNKQYDDTPNFHYCCNDSLRSVFQEKASSVSFLALVKGVLVTKGASNIATAPKLAAGLRLQSARSPFKANGTLTDDAIANSRKIIDASEIGDRAIPRGFSKFSTQTFQSPSGDFQTRFLRNENTGEVLFNNPNFKTIFNRTSGQK